MKSYVLSLLFIAIGSTAQEPVNAVISNSSLFSGTTRMPFWFVSNQNGKVKESAYYLNLTEVTLTAPESIRILKNLSYYAGANVLAGIGSSNYFNVNQAYSGLGYKNWELKAGWFQNEQKYDGLSSTNGDIHWSNNIRPMPRIRLSTDYFRLFLFPDWFSVHGLYEEAWLNDKSRSVQNARLHHKYLFFHFLLSSSSHLTAGLDHYVQWGGVHPKLGHLPSGFFDYFRYVLGQPGTEDFIDSDQRNMAGSHEGKYVISYHRQFQNSSLEIYLNHPFTDRMDLSNYKDNLTGMFYKLSNRRFIEAVIYEFMYTKFQRRVLQPDGSYSAPGGGNEPYFRHGIYRSGLSYQNRMFVTPFAIPLVIIDGVNLGTGNNRIVLHHLGLSGNYSELITWKTLLSYSNNLGTFNKAYDVVQPGFFDSARKQISAYGEIDFFIKDYKWNIKTAAAIDSGSLLENTTGFQIALTYHLF